MQHILDMSRSLNITWSLLVALEPFRVFIYGKFNSNYAFRFQFFIWSLNCTSLVGKFYISFRTILYFWTVLILEVIYQWLYLKVGFLLLLIFQIFLSLVHVMPVHHTIFWTWTMFYLRVFSTGIHKRCKFNTFLLRLVIFYDLEVTKFWSVSYIYLVYKLKFLELFFFFFSTC